MIRKKRPLIIQASRVTPVVRETSKSSITIIIDERWQGDNYIAIIRALNSVNQELKIRQKGSHLVIQDDEAGFYQVVPIGDLIEVPVKDCEPDEPIELVEKKEYSRTGIWAEGWS